MALTIPQEKWTQSSRFFHDDEINEINGATVSKSDVPKGFVVDEAQVDPRLRAKLRFHFVEKTGRIGRGAAL